MSVQAKRLDHFEEGIFSSIERKVVAYQQQGREVFNLSVGTPDFHPPEQVMQVLSQAALKPENYRYTLRDYPELRQAVQSTTSAAMAPPSTAAQRWWLFMAPRRGWGIWAWPCATPATWCCCPTRVSCF